MLLYIIIPTAPIIQVPLVSVVRVIGKAELTSINSWGLPELTAPGNNANLETIGGGEHRKYVIFSWTNEIETDGLMAKSGSKEWSLILQAHTKFSPDE